MRWALAALVAAVVGCGGPQSAPFAQTAVDPDGCCRHNLPGGALPSEGTPGPSCRAPGNSGEHVTAADCEPGEEFVPLGANTWCVPQPVTDADGRLLAFTYDCVVREPFRGVLSLRESE